MSGAPADTTDDVSSKVALLRALILPVTDVAAILAHLILIISKSSVESGEFTELVAFVIVLAFGRGSGLISKNWQTVEMTHLRGTHGFDNPVDQFHAGGNLILSVSCNKTMEIFFRVFGVLIRPSLPLLDASLSSDAYLGATVPLHLLQTVTAGTDQQAEEVNLGEFFDRDVDLLRRAVGTFLLLIFDGGSEVGIILHSTINQFDTLFFELFAVADLPSVCPATVIVVSGRWGRGPTPA